ncbi:hypothetical protein [Sphingomonas paeninsulae]|nr:hypothetical protein [Sphingomonas paeninsulae]
MKFWQSIITAELSVALARLSDLHLSWLNNVAASGIVIAAAGVIWLVSDHMAWDPLLMLKKKWSGST